MADSAERPQQGPNWEMQGHMTFGRLAETYPGRTVEELTNLWHAQSDLDKPPVALGEVFGVVNGPRDYSGLCISVDVDEVLRATHAAFAKQFGYDFNDAAYVHNYGSEQTWSGEKPTEEDMVLVVRTILALFHERMVSPVHGSENIKELMQNWRKQDGHLIIANTSTPSAGELITAEFLFEHFPECFDGLVFTRDRDNVGITKGRTLLSAIAEGGFEFPETVVHVDDKPGHLVDVREAMGELGAHVELYLPAYPGNREVAGYEGIHVAGDPEDSGRSPLAAFEAINQRLANF